VLEVRGEPVEWGGGGQSRAGHYLGSSLTPLPEHIPQLFALLLDEETVLYGIFHVIGAALPNNSKAKTC
jgi:hypothetical protein